MQNLIVKHWYFTGKPSCWCYVCCWKHVKK